MEIGEVKRPTNVIIDEALKGNKPRKYKKKPKKLSKRPAKPAVAIIKKPTPVARAVKKKSQKRPTKRPAKSDAAIVKKPKKPTPVARAASRPRNKKPTRGRLAPFAIAAIALAVLLLFAYIFAKGTGKYEVAPVAIVQEQKPAAEIRGNETEYVVKRGDTLFKIAERLTGSGWNYRSIAKYNQIENPNIIEIGQIIKIRLK